jgi:hypothetical protein
VVEALCSADWLHHAFNPACYLARVISANCNWHWKAVHVHRRYRYESHVLASLGACGAVSHVPSIASEIQERSSETFYSRSSHHRAERLSFSVILTAPTRLLWPLAWRVSQDCRQWTSCDAAPSAFELIARTTTMPFEGRSYRAACRAARGSRLPGLIDLSGPRARY